MALFNQNERKINFRYAPSRIAVRNYTAIQARQLMQTVFHAVKHECMIQAQLRLRHSESIILFLYWT